MIIFVENIIQKKYGLKRIFIFRNLLSAAWKQQSEIILFCLDN